jgi:antitoxin component of MazEF toxin-antitoxin module
VAEDAHFEVGDSLEIAVAADGTVQLHRVGAMPTLAQMVAQITPENRYSEVSVSAEIGREIVEW